MVYGIVAQHGGWIDVDSAPTEGTQVRVFLPAADAEAPDLIEGAPPDERDGGKGERVLVVEDEAVVRTLIDQSLRRYGYEVVATASAEQALAIFERESGGFQLVVSDVGLPGMDGVALMERLLRQRPDLKVLLATGYSSKTNWHAMRALGWPVLKKPFHLRELLRTVRKLLDGL